MSLDYSKKSSNLILDLINTKAKRPLLAEEIEYGIPEPIQDEGPRNTELIITPAPGNEKLINDAVLRYNRMDLEVMFGNVTVPLFEDEPEDLTPETFLAAINQRYTLGLSDEDFDFVTFKVVDGVAEITANSDGLVYFGSLSLAISSIERLDVIMGDGLLDGFVPPNLEGGVKPTYDVLFNVQPLSKYLVNGNIFSARVDPNNFISTTDGILEVCARIKASSSYTIAPPTSAAFTAIPSVENQAWSVSLHIGQDESLGSLLSAYDIVLSGTHLETEKTFSVILAPASSTVTIDSRTHTPVTLSDNSNLLYINRQAQRIGDFNGNAEQSTPYYGTFEYLVTATRKDGTKEPILLPFTVVCKKATV